MTAVNGVFICIEGLDGSGKSTQAKLLTKKLCKEGYDAFFTAEPSKGKIGCFIRKRLFDKERMSPSVEALLFAADRLEHVQRVIVPALQAGKIVISDRYVYSSLAYQGCAGLSLDWIDTINANAQKPDLSIFIDVAPEIVLKRLKRKKSVMENLQTQQRVQEIYQRYVEKGMLKRVDGSKGKNDVLEELYSTVICHLKLEKS